LVDGNNSDSHHNYVQLLGTS